MLTYSLKKEKGAPLYYLLYKYIKADIESGSIKGGERLPSKRRLAEDLGISVVTVENAYSQLLAEGYIYSVDRSGYYAEKDARKRPVYQTRRVENKARAEKKAESAADYTDSRPSAEGFPFSVWAKLMRETLLEGAALLVPPENKGAAALRRAISAYLYRSRGIAAPPENIVIGAGTEYIYSLLVQLFGADKKFGVEDPGYKKTAAIYGANGAECVYLPLDGQGVNMRALEKSGVEILHITPTHHYPTGIITPIGRRREILDWAEAEQGRYIIEDDYDSEFRFAGKPIPTLQSIDGAQRVIYINTFSKSLAPSMRISYMVLPTPLLRKYEEKLGVYACAVPVFEQITLAGFIDGGYFERHLSRMRTVYKKRRAEIADGIAALKKRDCIRIIPADTGLHFLLKVHTEKTDAALKEAAGALGVKILCLSDYSVLKEKRYEHYILIDYSFCQSADLSFLDKIL